MRCSKREAKNMIHIRTPLYLILPNTESSCSPIQGCQIYYIPYIYHFFTSISGHRELPQWSACKGVLTWHRDDFRAGASSLRFPLMALYLFTWYHHKMSCRCESPRRKFTPVTVPELEIHSVQNFATVSCKHQTTTCFGVKSVCRWTGSAGSAYVIFAILNRTCTLWTWSVPSNK